MKHDVTAIIVLMTFLCDLSRGCELLPAAGAAAAAAAAAAAEVDGPAACCSLCLTRIEREALPTLLLRRSAAKIFQ